MKRLTKILNISIWAFIGTFIGNGIYTFWDFNSHPDLYAIQSAPWYTNIIFQGIITIIAVVILIVIKFIMKKKR